MMTVDWTVSKKTPFPMIGQVYGTGISEVYSRDQVKTKKLFPTAQNIENH